MDKRIIRIGITNCAKYDNYRRWVENAAAPVEIVRLGGDRDNGNELATLDGLVLTGGEDVHPSLYGKPEYETAYQLKDFNEARDSFEYGVIQKWMRVGKPILCICRGLQVMNVFLGGTLIPDIPTVFALKDHGKRDGRDQRHPVGLTPGSLLSHVSGVVAGEVNSAHHQSVAEPGKGLRVTALSEEVVVEAMEWEQPAGQPWLLMVQWHPERMSDPENPLADRIRDHFLNECNQ
jgi:putative glutamine amidotransferase